MSAGSLCHCIDLGEITLNPFLSTQVGFQIPPKDINSKMHVSLYFLIILDQDSLFIFLIP